MTTFTDTWNAAFEGLPADADLLAQGASRIRELKVAISERMEVDHSWAGDGDDGVHLQLTMPDRATDPTFPAGQLGIWNNGDELFVRKGSGAVSSLSNQSEFVSGTRMVFHQTAAPTGWTKETNAAYNDNALRIVTGTIGNGGADNFSTVFTGSRTTDGHTLTTSEIPAHTHTYAVVTTGGGVNPGGDAGGGTTTSNTGSTGGGGSHSHDISNMDLKYRDIIIAQKD